MQTINTYQIRYRLELFNQIAFVWSLKSRLLKSQNFSKWLNMYGIGNLRICLFLSLCSSKQFAFLYLAGSMEIPVFLNKPFIKWSYQDCKIVQQTVNLPPAMQVLITTHLRIFCKLYIRDNMPPTVNYKNIVFPQVKV